MNRRIAHLSVLMLLIMFASPCFGQASSSDIETWKSLTPLVSTREQIEQVTGPLMSGDKDVSIYDTKSVRLTVWYGPLQSAGKECQWRVPPNVAVGILVVPKENITLRQLGFDMSKFEKKRTENEDVWNYLNVRQGIRIHVQEADPHERVMHFYFSPKRDERKAKCTK